MLYIDEMKYLNTKAACDILHVNKYTLYRWGDQGKVKMFRQEVGNLSIRLFDSDDVARLAGKLPKKRKQGFRLFAPVKKQK